MARVLITGASGFLGFTLARVALEAGFDVAATARRDPGFTPPIAFCPADLTDPGVAEALLDAAAPDAVLHLAALSAPNACEADPERSRAVNVAAGAELARAAALRGAAFAFASTDLVFDGLSAPYAEDAQVNPVSAYGRHKAAAERAVLAAHPRALVCRLPLLFGPPTPFAPGFPTLFARSLRSGEPARLFVDEFRTPADTVSVARGLLQLTGTASGILHLGGRERVSRYELGMRTARAAGIRAPDIRPTRQAELRMAAPRPPDVSLDSTRAYALGYDPAPLDAALATCFA